MRNSSAEMFTTLGEELSVQLIIFPLRAVSTPSSCFVLISAGFFFNFANGSHQLHNFFRSKFFRSEAQIFAILSFSQHPGLINMIMLDRLAVNPLLRQWKLPLYHLRHCTDRGSRFNHPLNRVITYTSHLNGQNSARHNINQFFNSPSEAYDRVTRFAGFFTLFAYWNKLINNKDKQTHGRKGIGKGRQASFPLCASESAARARSWFR